MTERRFPSPWIDAQGQALAYVYSRENPSDAAIAKVLTEDEARRIASNIAKAAGAAWCCGSFRIGFSRGGRLVGE
jgi:hypothetical protein